MNLFCRFLHRSSNRHSCIPSAGYAPPNGGVLYTDNVCPLGNATGNAIECNNPIIPSIPVLFGSCRPVTVLWCVIVVVISALNRIALMALAHISEKIFVRSAPAITNKNASRAVVFKAACARRIATGNHSFPDSMCFCARCPVCFKNGFRVRLMDAAARVRFPSQVAAANNFFIATLAQTLPKQLAVLVFRNKTENCEFMEFMTSKVVANFHFFTLKWLTGNVAWQSAVRQIFGSYPSQAVKIVSDNRTLKGLA